MIYLAVSILFLVFGICTAIADTLLFHYSTSRFKNLPLKYREFLDVSLSSSNKYKGSDSKQGPRFFGSTTIFVVFTDGWHLFKAIGITAAVLGSFLCSSIWLLLFFFIVGKIVFEVVFRWLEYKSIF